MDNKDIDREKLKAIQLNLLKLFIEVCKKYNLKYYCVGGTLLGAVRHGGYIPWDDDIDVAMPREDYEKFLIDVRKDLPERYFIQTTETDKEYLQTFAKLRDSNTTYIETTSAKLNINHGVYIDVFVLDGYPKSKTAQKKLTIQKKVMEFYRSPKWNLEESAAKRKIRKLVAAICYPVLSPSKVIKSFEKMIKKYKCTECDYVISHGGAWGKKEIYPKCFFGEGSAGKFENIDVVFPDNYDDFLKHVYGDYMKFPPPEEQVPHHDVDVVDFEKSYTEYISEKQ